MHVFNPIKEIISSLNVNSVTTERKQILQPLIDYINSRVSQNKDIRLNFICTHNSRRSHLSQVWAQTLAHHFNIKNVYCYSGGTETTALFPQVLDTLINSGFQIHPISNNGNPIYSIKYADNEWPIVGFSKLFNDDFNPKSDFAAIMTCSSANEACPFVAGAEKRIPITYEDPKLFDNTAQQVEKYHERSIQIATELSCVFSQINI